MRLTEAYRSLATSFVGSWCQGIPTYTLNNLTRILTQRIHSANSHTQVVKELVVPERSGQRRCAGKPARDSTFTVSTKRKLDGPDVVCVLCRTCAETHADIILRKEVIQPQVPLRLPCYDLVPITKLAFGAALLAVGLATSGALSFRGLTGGVYKAQEHIHRGVADPRLLAIPTSCRRVAACNPN